MFGMLSGGFAIAMALGNLVGYAFAFLIGREMKIEADTNTKKCPECAELIKLEAMKCRYCGAKLEVKNLNLMLLRTLRKN